MSRELIEAAQAVVDRWDSPKWKDEAPTADFIYRLRDAIAAARKADATIATQAARSAALEAHIRGDSEARDVKRYESIQRIVEDRDMPMIARVCASELISCVEESGNLRLETKTDIVNDPIKQIVQWQKDIGNTGEIVDPVQIVKHIGYVIEECAEATYHSLDDQDLAKELDYFATYLKEEYEIILSRHGLSLTDERRIAAIDAFADMAVFAIAGLMRCGVDPLAALQAVADSNDSKRSRGASQDWTGVSRSARKGLTANPPST